MECCFYQPFLKYSSMGVSNLSPLSVVDGISITKDLKSALKLRNKEEEDEGLVT